MTFFIGDGPEPDFERRRMRSRINALFLAEAVFAGFLGFLLVLVNDGLRVPAVAWAAIILLIVVMLYLLMLKLPMLIQLEHAMGKSASTPKDLRRQLRALYFFGAMCVFWIARTFAMLGGELRPREGVTLAVFGFLGLAIARDVARLHAQLAALRAAAPE
ncbi:MAG: hypothetical protein ACM30I_10410 [Gemmatimonas sp.]